MYFYKKEDGSVVSCYKPIDGLEEITKEAFDERMNSTIEKLEKLAELHEKTRHLTAEEVTALLIKQQINTLSVDDATALRMLAFYPEWASDTDYTAGYKVQYGGKLWRCVQAHTAQTGWDPENAASLWTEICETHDGTIDDPIPYSGNMALESGKYYLQDYVIYRCTRDTINPVYNALSELVGIYVEATE